MRDKTVLDLLRGVRPPASPSALRKMLLTLLGMANLSEISVSCIWSDSYQHRDREMWLPLIVLCTVFCVSNYAASVLQ